MVDSTHRPFKLFGLSHFLAVVTTLGIIFFLLHKLDEQPRDKLKQRIHPFLGRLLLLWPLFFRLVYILNHDFHIQKDFPFHLCSIGSLLLGYYFLRPNKKLYDVIFYWVLSGGTLAFIFPDLEVDFPSFRFFSMFFGHGLMLFAILYLVFVCNQKPSDSGKWSILYINLLILFLIPVNVITKGNYLFLREVPQIEFGPISLLPQWPWYIIILELFAILYFRLLYFAFVEHPVWHSQVTHKEAPSAR